MRKDVVELFAGVGGFRVGLNNIKEFDEDGIAIENEIGILYGQINGNLLREFNMHSNAINKGLIYMNQKM